MITVYGRATSSNVQAVMWCIGELGLEHERLDYGHSHGGVDTPLYKSMNPNGLVPTVVDGDGAPMWESAAIVRYLATKYGNDQFWPKDPAERAQVDMWAEWGKSTMYPAFSLPIFWPKVRTAAVDRDEAQLLRSIEKFEQILQLPARQLAGKRFLCGDHLTVADIISGHLLFRYFDMDIERNPPEEIKRYYTELKQRPAFREHVMVDYSALRAHGA